MHCLRGLVPASIAALALLTDDVKFVIWRRKVVFGSVGLQADIGDASPARLKAGLYRLVEGASSDSPIVCTLQLAVTILLAFGLLLSGSQAVLSSQMHGRSLTRQNPGRRPSAQRFPGRPLGDSIRLGPACIQVNTQLFSPVLWGQ